MHKIFTNSQFGFREKHSTIHAVLHFIDKVVNATDNHFHLISIFLDFSKAFDTINHDILLYKLSHYGIRGKALEWFKSYLSNRRQFVTIKNDNSVIREVKCGVPQGSLLGPLLFIIYINDFCQVSEALSFIHFADDTNVFLVHSDIDVLVRKVNSELKKVTNWVRANKLSLNVQKTKYMLFSNTVGTLSTDIVLDDTSLERISHFKFLGVILDEKLSWKLHIDYICNIISRNIGVINRLKLCLPKKSLLMLYSSLILPYHNYGLLVWGNTHQNLLDRVFLLQKKALRVICYSPIRSHTDALFASNKLLKFRDLFLFSLGQFMYMYNNNLLPDVFHSMFLKNQSFHEYPTRRSNEYHLPLFRTILAKNTFVYTGPSYWNSMHPDIKNAPSIYSFKRKLKVSLLQPYSTE